MNISVPGYKLRMANGWVEEGELVEQVINLESQTYRQVTVETLALLNWMRRFVDGLMKDVDDTETSDA